MSIDGVAVESRSDDLRKGKQTLSARRIDLSLLLVYSFSYIRLQTQRTKKNKRTIALEDDAMDHKGRLSVEGENNDC